jgi:hypothetical protein
MEVRRVIRRQTLLGYRPVQIAYHNKQKFYFEDSEAKLLSNLKSSTTSSCAWFNQVVANLSKLANWMLFAMKRDYERKIREWDF